MCLCAYEHDSHIKVIGIGSLGINAINSMISANLERVDFIAINTNSENLLTSKASHQLVFEPEAVCQNSDVAELYRQKLITLSEGADVIFIVCGLGGHCETSLLSFVAESVQNICLTIAAVTLPFLFEGSERAKHALTSLKKLTHRVDSTITIPSYHLQNASGDHDTDKLFSMATSKLSRAVLSISSSLICKTDHFCCEFANLLSAMSNSRISLYGEGRAPLAPNAAENVIRDPLLKDLPCLAYKAALIPIIDYNITLEDFASAAEILEAKLKNQFVDDPDIFINLYTPKTAPDEVSISLFVAGIAPEAFLTKAEEVYGIQPLRPHVAKALKFSLQKHHKLYEDLAK